MKKTQTPNPKHQRNTKDQISNSHALFGVWKLEFIWSLEFGVWYFCDRLSELALART